ncbi:MAG: hypothetical protein HGA49_04655 [Eubacteriaceae bacterium]|nr:hypothetical protein [Eubacteriaceae bacterium]
MISLIEVTNKKTLKKFVEFPLALYKNHPYYVPKLFGEEMAVLDPRKNPASEHCDSKLWLAYKENKIVGRIAAIVNYHYLEKWQMKNGRFGYVDFIEDFEIAKALFDTAESWLKSKGMTGIHGPLGFCDLDPEGMLVDGFDKIGTFTTIYNYPYYPVFLEQLGYSKDVDWVEYEMMIPDEPPKKLMDLAGKIIDRYELKLPVITSKKMLLPYVNSVFEIINETYSDLYAVTELTKKQIDYYIKQYFTFISPYFVRLILDKNDKLVAFGLTLPSLAKAMQKSRGKLFPFGFIHILKALYFNDRGEFVLIAVRKEYQLKGVNAVLLSFITLKNKYHISKADLNPQLESNTKVRSQWKYFEAEKNKTRRCYIKKI